MTGRGTAEDGISLLLSLRAVRRFPGDPVPQGVVDDVLEVARLSGSAANGQYPDEGVRRGTLSLKPLSEIVHEERYG